MATFEHPFFKKKIQREIFDISPTGFSIFDYAEEELLVPGMILHDLSIVYAGELKMTCTAQVLYRNKQDEARICCGVAIMDMDIHSYSRLNRILSLTIDSHSSISTEVDIDALWKFFFDSGLCTQKSTNYFKIIAKNSKILTKNSIKKTQKLPCILPMNETGEFMVICP